MLRLLLRFAAVLVQRPDSCTAQREISWALSTIDAGMKLVTSVQMAACGTQARLATRCCSHASVLQDASCSRFSAFAQTKPLLRRWS